MQDPAPTENHGADRPGLYATELFSAIQGEGALVGYRQVFFRLSGCNIRCTYCDQPEALERKAGEFRFETEPGSRRFSYTASPMADSEALEKIMVLWQRERHHSLSLTGGEPLAQSRRLEWLCSELATRNVPLYLETNGILADGLGRLQPYLSYVSMDIKLDSVDAQGVPLAKHSEFLARSLGLATDTDRPIKGSPAPLVFAKIVISGDVDRGELLRSVEMVHEVSNRAVADLGSSPVEVFLQPLTPFGAAENPPSPEQVLGFHSACLAVHPQTRVVPQTHKLIGQL